MNRGCLSGKNAATPVREGGCGELLVRAPHPHRRGRGHERVGTRRAESAGQLRRRIQVDTCEDGSRFYINGQHKTRAMLDEGVRRTIVIRWQDSPRPNHGAAVDNSPGQCW